MCGIAGFLRLSADPGVSATAEDARRMADAMPHRGPDGRGAWAEGPVALAHARLAIRDRSPAGAQPMVTSGGEGVLVYNGEVYNDAEIRADLARDGLPAGAIRSTGDAEVVLHAIARWGVEAAAKRFDGMFAFAWWDRRDKALWLVRDRFGTKPLHVAVEPQRVAFASEIRGLRALPGFVLRPDPVEIVRRIFPSLVDELRPPFAGVENVLPGEAWRIRAAGIERRMWFDLAANLDVDRIIAAGREPVSAWEDRVEAAMTRAVREHLASDVPLAAFTSGGVDSNLVAALARDDRPDLVAYTVDTGGEDSEIEATTAIAKHVGYPLRVLSVDRAAYLRAWPEAVEAVEHPPIHTSTPASLLLARAARADGIVVALTGEGSDELFGGYDFFRHTRRRWQQLLWPWRRILASDREAARDLSEVPFRYQALKRVGDGHLRLAAALLPVEETRARALLTRFERLKPAADRAFLAHTLDSLPRHLGWILLRHDRVGMAASLEARVPFLSNRVADVALHLPVKAKIRGRVGKWILKRVAAKRLPKSRMFAKKQGFPIPPAHHAGTTTLLRDGAVPELLRWTKGAADDLIPRIEADVRLRHHLVGLEIWGRLFVRGERADSIAERLLAGGAAP